MSSMVGAAFVPVSMGPHVAPVPQMYIQTNLFQKKLIENLTDTFKAKPRKIFNVSDGCAAQYKDRNFYINLCHLFQALENALLWERHTDIYTRTRTKQTFSTKSTNSKTPFCQEGMKTELLNH